MNFFDHMTTVHYPTKFLQLALKGDRGSGARPPNVVAIRN